MIAKTYENLSDNFDELIRKYDYRNIIRENSISYGNYKNNCIAEFLKVEDGEFKEFLEQKEDKLSVRNDRIYSLIEEQVLTFLELDYNHVIEGKEKELMRYLQDKEGETIPFEIYTRLNGISQALTRDLSNYKLIQRDESVTEDFEEIEKTISISKSIPESKKILIDNCLWMLSNIVINDFVNVDTKSIAEGAGIEEYEVDFFLKQSKDILDIPHNLFEAFHTWLRRLHLKVDNYLEVFEEVAKGKRYNEENLPIKDFSYEPLSKSEKYELGREAITIKIEEIEKDEVNETGRPKEPKKKNRFSRIRDRFK